MANANPDDKIKIVAPVWAVWTVVGALVVLALGVAFVALQLAQQSAARSVPPTTLALLSPLSTPMPVVVTTTPAGVVAAVRMNNAELRAAPGASGTLLGLVSSGPRLVVRSRTADNQWLRVETDDGVLGWLPVGAVDLRGASLDKIPVSVLAALPPPTAAPRPTATLVVAAQPPAPTVVPAAASQAGSSVRVLDSAPVREAGALNLRAARDTASALVDKAQVGELLAVLGRVVEGDGVAWLLVRSPRDKEGWVREKDGNTPLVALPGQEPPPVPVAPTAAAAATLKPTTAPAATAAPAVTAAAPSGPVLYNVKVLDTQAVRGAGALNLRAQRDTTAAIVDSAAIGETLAVYERMAEADGTPWLRVRSPRGKEGWVREKDGETVLVERIR